MTDPIRDASKRYDVERRVRHAERPGFRINELQISPTQSVPWHCHTVIVDTIYVIAGHGSATFLAIQGVGESESCAVHPPTAPRLRSGVG